MPNNRFDCVGNNLHQIHGLRVQGFKKARFLARWWDSLMEANIHGIAFGQRLIDGKVEGRSFTDMKATDRGATPRHRVQFRATFSSCSILEGTGTLLEPPLLRLGHLSRVFWISLCALGRTEIDPVQITLEAFLAGGAQANKFDAVHFQDTPPDHRELNLDGRVGLRSL